MTTDIEEQANTAATPAKPEGKATKTARVAPRKPRVAPAKARTTKKAAAGKNAAQGAKKAKAARAGSKTAKILDLLQRPGGATLKELMKATGWQAHSVRGFLSGAVGKKMGLKVESIKREDGERAYQVA